MSASVAWMGAAFVFLGHAVIGLTSENPNVVRGVYLVMEPAAWFGLVPLACAAVVTGIVQSLGTTWGLFRHYWVVFKLLLTVFATLVLFIYMGTFRQMAAAAADTALDIGAVRNPSPALHAGLAIAVLLIATALAMHKPVGLTPFGRGARGASSEVADKGPAGRRSALFVAAMIAVVLMLAMVLGHLAGGHGAIRH